MLDSMYGVLNSNEFAIIGVLVLFFLIWVIKRIFEIIKQNHSITEYNAQLIRLQWIDSIISGLVKSAVLVVEKKLKQNPDFKDEDLMGAAVEIVVKGLRGYNIEVSPFLIESVQDKLEAEYQKQKASGFKIAE